MCNVSCLRGSVLIALPLTLSSTLFASDEMTERGGASRDKVGISEVNYVVK